MNIDLTGHTALVTGATSELGRTIVPTLAECGADIAIHYFSAIDKADMLKSKVEGMGRRACVVQADVTKKDAIDSMKSAVEDELGPPDIIVNNAVIQYAWANVLDQSPDDYRSQFESSVLHNVFMSQVFVPAMIEKRWGRVIGINTECSMQYWKNQSAYISGKRGMDGVLRVLAREVGEHQITVNQVAPGWTISEARQDDSTEAHIAYKSNVPLQRRGHEQDIANAIAFLASDLASFITGAYIPVCGGNIMPAI